MFITSSWSQVDVLVDVNSQKLNRKKKKNTQQSFTFAKLASAFFVSLMNLKSIIRTVADTFSQSEKSIYRAISSNKTVLKALLFVPRTHFK